MSRSCKAASPRSASFRIRLVDERDRAFWVSSRRFSFMCLNTNMDCSGIVSRSPRRNGLLPTRSYMLSLDRKFSLGIPFSTSFSFPCLYQLIRRFVLFLKGFGARASQEGQAQMVVPCLEEPARRHNDGRIGPTSRTEYSSSVCHGGCSLQMACALYYYDRIA